MNSLKLLTKTGKTRMSTIYWLEFLFFQNGPNAANTLSLSVGNLFSLQFKIQITGSLLAIVANQFMSMSRLAHQTSIASWFQSNSRPSRRWKLAIISSNVCPPNSTNHIYPYWFHTGFMNNFDVTLSLVGSKEMIWITSNIVHVLMISLRPIEEKFKKEIRLMNPIVTSRPSWTITSNRR